MKVYANLLGAWTLLDEEEDNICGATPSEFISDFFIINEKYKDITTVCVTHKFTKYVIPISFIQVADY